MKLQIATLPLLVLLTACGGDNAPDSSLASCGTLLGNGGCQASTSTATTDELLLKPKKTTTYAAIGGSQQLTETIAGTRRTEEYASEITGAATGKLAVTYNPDTDVFTVKVSTVGAGVSTIYDDPLYRTAFGGARQPQVGVPNLPGFLYLQRSPLPGTPPQDVQTFFYKTPGTTTRYVTLAGFVRNAVGPIASTTATNLDGAYQRSRSVEVFGIQTPAGAVPTAGKATFRGDMLASAIYNTELDITPTIRSRMDWISGQAVVGVDFTANKVTADFSGTFLATPDAFANLGPYNSSNAGKSFSASGVADIGTDRASYLGTIATMAIGGVSITPAASQVTGGFFGPNAAETGGGFRITGGVPDQRVEIVGAFTGAR